MSNYKKERPAGATAGQGGNCAPVSGALGRRAGHCHYTPRAPRCQALFARWLAQARACADRDLSAAERAKASGDLETFHRLRRRGLRHQVLQVALEAALGG